MATLTIRNLDDAVHANLRKRAAEHGRSMEAEAREILADRVAPKYATGAEFLEVMRGCMSESGGFREGEFIQPDRPPPRDPPDFSE